MQIILGLVVIRELKDTEKNNADYTDVCTQVSHVSSQFCPTKLPSSCIVVEDQQTNFSTHF